MLEYIKHKILYVSTEPIFPIYIRLLIVFCLGISIYLLHKNKKKLNAEINERKKVEEALIENKAELEAALALSRATIEASADGIVVLDRNKNIIVYNQKFADLWHIPPHMLSLKRERQINRLMVKQLENPVDFFRALKRLQTSGHALEHRDEVRFKDGRIFEFYTIPQVHANEIMGHVFSFRDVTARKEVERQLIFQATHDMLTTLPNRLLLHDRIQYALASYRRTHQAASILFFDLDGFKAVNDKLGHDMGDILLQAVAKRLESCVRSQDTVARWGGDEFVAVLASVFQEEYVIPIIQKILKIVEEPIIIDKHKIKITISVGVSILPKDGETSAILIRNADIAMQHAKMMGRNNYAFYTQQMDDVKTPYRDL